jgi:hypothetical protein
MEREYVPRSTGGGGERGKAKESREDDMVKDGGVIMMALMTLSIKTKYGYWRWVSISCSRQIMR